MYPIKHESIEIGLNCTRTNENCISKKRYYIGKTVCQYIFHHQKQKTQKKIMTQNILNKNYLHKQAKNVRLKSIAKYYFLFPINLSAKSIKKCTFKIYLHFSIYFSRASYFIVIQILNYFN